MITRVLVALTVGAATVLPVASAAPAQAVESVAYLNSYEAQVVAAMNVQRTVRGLRPLSYTSCPDRYAEYLSSRLRTSSTLYHQSMTTILRGCGATRVAENIVRTRRSATSLVNLWMASPVHRANILNPYLTQVGVGTTCSTLCTTVADFIRP